MSKRAERKARESSRAKSRKESSTRSWNIDKVRTRDIKDLIYENRKN